MRYYTALPVPPQVSTALSAVRGDLPGARWVDPARYHITLAYLGALEEKEVAQVTSILGQPNLLPWQRRPLHLACAGLGIFRNQPEAALYASVAQRIELLQLHLLHKNVLAPYMRGKPAYPEYNPHITLASFPPAAMGEALALADRCRRVGAHEFQVAKFHLYGSDGQAQRIVGTYSLA